MLNLKMFVFVFAVFSMAGLLIVPEKVSAQDALQGVWKITETAFSSSDTSWTNNSPQPSLYIFTGKYYSIMLVFGTAPRPLVADDATRDTITDNEMKSMFMQFIANSGTYELEGSKITTRPIVALWPNFMEGGSAEYEYSVQGNVLSLKEMWLSGEFKTKLTKLK